MHLVEFAFIFILLLLFAVSFAAAQMEQAGAYRAMHKPKLALTISLLLVAATSFVAA